MPIYAYRCDACGHAKDVLQKMSDPQLTDCPSCGKAEFKKQLTAAGFQLKGTGWYVTDFREGGAKKSAPAEDARSDTSATATPVAGNSPAAANAAESAPTTSNTAAPVAVPAPASAAPSAVHSSP